MNIAIGLTRCLFIITSSECRKIINSNSNVNINMANIMREGECSDYPNHLNYNIQWGLMRIKATDTCPNSMFKFDVYTFTTTNKTHHLRGNTPSEKIICCKNEIVNEPDIINDYNAIHSSPHLNMYLRRHNNMI